MATGTELGGPVFRSARDVTTLRLDLNVPAGATCLSFGFRFMSEEFPEWVGSQYNDAFIAELDNNTWSATGTAPVLVAPSNFATDLKGNPVSINAIGDVSVSPSQASSTMYDAATRRLRAATPVTPGLHRLYLSIIEQGDHVYDSAVMIDHLMTSGLTSCAAGIAVDTQAAQPAGAIEVGKRVSIPQSEVFLPIRLKVGLPKVSRITSRPISSASAR